MPYLMGGFPDLDASRAVGESCIDAGANLLELGVPFSDPLADGPVIHAAATDALAAGATLHGVLRVCESLAEQVPVVLMVYANAVLAGGNSAFVERAAAAGAAGLIVPDLPHDEAGGLREVCDSNGLALVPLAAPNTPPERLAQGDEEIDIGADDEHPGATPGMGAERALNGFGVERTPDRLDRAERHRVGGRRETSADGRRPPGGA